MESRKGETRQVSFNLLPTICEYRHFSCEEDFQRTEVDNSKLIKTSSGFSTLPQRFEDDEDSEKERLLLSLYTRDSKFCDEGWKSKLAKRQKVQKRRYNKTPGMEWKPNLAKGWKMQKRKVKNAWANSHRCRQSLKSSVKVLSDSPLLLLKTVRDAYVSVMTRLERKCNRRMWYLAGARIL